MLNAVLAQPPGHYSKDFKWDEAVTWQSFRRDYIHSFWLSTGAITGAQGHRPSTPAAKFFGVFWAIYAVMLYANYTASTTSMLIAPPSVLSVQSFRQLKEDNIPVCVKVRTRNSTLATHGIQFLIPPANHNHQEKTAYYQKYLKVEHKHLNYVYEYNNR